MLKRIAPREVRLGMYIQSFDGRWLAHPFWRSRFHVTDPDDLARVRASRVDAVVIDDEKGIMSAAAGVAAPMPACVADDVVPEQVVPDDVRRPRSSPAAAVDGRRLTRHIFPEAESPASAQAERAAILRVLGTSAQLVREAFDGVSRGYPLSLERLGGVVDEVSTMMARNREMMIGISRLKSKDEYTFFHSVAVSALMIGFGRELGLDETVVRELGLGGLIHDVGKMHIGDAILNKPGPLTDAEFAVMKRHPALGHEILSRDENVPPIAMEVTLRHHERLNGSGYPGGLAGDEVSLHARMAGICDVFDALTSARAYKEAMPAHEAITMMAGWTGHFDRDLLVVFMRSIGRYPAGLLVRLSSQRLAIVLPPGRHAGRPRARVVHCAATDTPLPPSDVVISAAGQGERVLSEEAPEGWAIADWPALLDRVIGAAARRAA